MSKLGTKTTVNSKVVVCKVGFDCIASIIITDISKEQIFI